MSLHTILSQMNASFKDKFVNETVKQVDASNSITLYHWKNPHSHQSMEVLDFFHSFATRIVEEVGKELIKISCANCQQEKFVSQDDVMREALRFWREHKTRIGNSYCKIDHIDIDLRTKLQKMKGDL